MPTYQLPPFCTSSLPKAPCLLDRQTHLSHASHRNVFFSEVSVLHGEKMESSRTGGLYLDQDIQITNEQPTTSGSRNKRGKGRGDQVSELRGCQIGKGACAKGNKLP